MSNNSDDVKRIYDRTGNNPKAWRRHAEELLIAHSILYHEYKQIDYTKLESEGYQPDEDRVLLPALMLLSFAIECLFKELWLKQGNLLAENGKYKKIPNAQSHNLFQYGKAVGLNFDKDEQVVLNRLHKISVSLGRYPIPIRFEDSHLRKTPDIGFQTDIHWGPSDDFIVEKIITKITGKVV
jgi:hypothetical protein